MSGRIVVSEVRSISPTDSLGKIIILPEDIDAGNGDLLVLKVMAIKRAHKLGVLNRLARLTLARSASGRLVGKMPNAPKMDWVALALGLAGGHELTPVQLQKAVFLLQKYAPHLGSEQQYAFVPHNYGPFSRAVYQQAETLSDFGQAEIGSTQNGYSVYRGSPGLVSDVDGYLSGLDVRDREYVVDLIDWVRRQSFSSLVKAVYEKFPEYRVNSVFQG